MKIEIKPLFLALFVTLSFLQSCENSDKIKLLVFSKTDGFRHESIESGIAALQQLAAEKGFEVDFTEDADQFKEKVLQNYQAVIFLNTTGDILNEKQQEAFERFIQAGGGYLGIHSATDTEYEWPWYGKLAGAYFLDHPSEPSNVQTGKLIVTEKNHWATTGMPDEFEWTDEFYNFKDISDNIHMVLTIDESTYIGGKNPDYHPMSWYQEFDGGRSFYTALGHTKEAFTDAMYINHLWAGIQYVVGGERPVKLDYTKSKPEQNRFSKVVLLEDLDEPMELTLLDENRVLFIQRKGEVMLFNNITKEVKEIAKIPVSTNYVNKAGEESMGEDGLLGLNKDPNFEQNHWIYLYYSTTEKSANVLARFEMKGDELLMDSKKILLEIPVQREECCHTAGSIAWDKDGNLYLSTGDNTSPRVDGFSPSDEREGRAPWDAQKSSANTNDLRGKIIRIKPQPDGTYTIPEGNLFPVGTEKTRPEIYTMGHRNPFRISVDKKTGYVYWGEVGPDANDPDSLRGPAGHDEVGQARAAGNFGWPHFVADNKAYFKYDFATGETHELWNPEAPVNTSPNNTGLEQLPPAKKAFIWYPYGESAEFPLVGTGSRNAMAGPVFYSSDFRNADHAFPSYYDGKLLIYDWMRGWIMAVTLDEEGNYKSMERFMPDYKYSNPMDMEFASNGDLYMLEYGTGWFSQNSDARLIRIEYTAGNRNPVIQANANKLGGAVPFDLKLTSSGTMDPDEDVLNYSWKVTSSQNNFEKEFKTTDAQLTIETPGVYQAILTVSDENGGSSTSKFTISAGNEPPVVNIDLPNGNRSFYVANTSFNYTVQVNDKEDGTLGNGIDAARVSLAIDYLAEGFDKTIITQGHQTADDISIYSGGKKLIESLDCKGCHAINKKSIGPSYSEVAKKYKGNPDAVSILSEKVISGGSGVWGDVPMAAHPNLSQEDAKSMVKFILNLSAENKNSLPLTGSFLAEMPKDDKGLGVFIMRASYTDNGANNLPATLGEQTYVLRNNKIPAHGLDMYQGIMKLAFGGMDLLIISTSGAYAMLEQIDLNNLQELKILASTPIQQLNSVGGKAELRAGSPDGPLLGESNYLEPSDQMGFTPSLLSIPIDASAVDTSELHQLYIVFKNKDNADKPLMVVFGTEFILNSSK